jgi:cytochrome c oxidase subunit 4
MHALSEQVEAHYSVTAYTIVFGALVCLTILSFLLSYASLGWFETVVALAIAAAKVLLVVIYFMHLSKEPVSHRLAALAAALFVAILATLAAADVWTRYS